KFQNPISPCDTPIDFSTPISPVDQYYGYAILLLENLGSSTTELLSAYSGAPNSLESSLDSFSIIKEGDTYYLWLASRLRTSVTNTNVSIEQRFESKNGLVWCNRTNTNLSRSDTYKYLLGLRNVIKSGSLYEG